MELNRPATGIVVAAVVVGVALIAVTGARKATESPCGPGFVRSGFRCSAPAGSCPKPLVPAAGGCDAPGDDRASVPEISVTIGPSDWEAEGRVRSRVVHTGAFWIDRFEVSVGHVRATPCPRCPKTTGDDPARAASRATLDEARAYCRARRGRLPTEDEWIVAAAGDRPRRYPWGDTGAVCRRGAWGLVDGPCARGADGPDTVGAHPDGDSPLGIHDLAGNVAEWVETGSCPENGPLGGECLGVVRGGSYRTSLATGLRTWVRAEVSSASREPWIGFRCAYDDNGLP